MIRRGHSVGNAAKWSTPRCSGTVRGSVGMVHTDPGSLPNGLRYWFALKDRCVTPLPLALSYPQSRGAVPFTCGSRISSTAEKYRGWVTKWNQYSWERRTRSVTDSGGPLGLDQMISAGGMRTSWSMQARAYREGMPMRDLGRPAVHRGVPWYQPCPCPSLTVPGLTRPV